MILHPKPAETRSTYVGMQRFEVPLYSTMDVPDLYCARYARLAARQIFGKHFPVAPAWGMKRNSSASVQVENNAELCDLLESGKIAKGGLLVGVHFEGSDYNQPGRLYTHMSLLLAVRNGKPIFLEQFEDIRVVTLDDYEMDGLQIVELLGV